MNGSTTILADDTSVTQPSPFYQEGELRLRPKVPDFLNLPEPKPTGVVFFYYDVAEVPSLSSTNWEKQLKRLASLESNWDTYGAEAPSEQAIETAKSFLAMLGETDLDPTRVAPSAEGGVAVSFMSDGRSYMIEFFNDGDISAVWSDGRGEIDAEEYRIEDTERDWQPVLSRIRGILVG